MALAGTMSSREGERSGRRDDERGVGEKGEGELSDAWKAVSRYDNRAGATKGEKEEREQQVRCSEDFVLNWLP